MKTTVCVLVVLIVATTFCFHQQCVFAQSQTEYGIKLFKSRKYAQAAQAFEKSIGEKPSPTDYYYLGLSYYYVGKRTKTKATFEKLVEKFPDSSAASRAKPFLAKISGSSGRAGSRTSSTTANSSRGSILPRFCRVHYKAVGEDIVVDTQVNGRPISMIFDTGAPDTWIGTNHLKELGIPLPKGKYRKMQSQLGEDKKYKYWEAKIDLKIGLIVRKNFPVLVQENRNGMPLIGQTFVDGYKFKIDHKSNELVFNSKSVGRSAYANSSRTSRNEVKFVTGKGDYVWIEAKVNGKPCKMVFDTGASDVYFPTSYVSKYGINVPPNAKVHRYEKARPARSAYVRRLQVGPIDVSNFEVLVTDWSNLDEPLLGVSFYKNWEYTIDRKRKVIRFLRR